jgi:ABC-type Fe3+-siderophore transport system permease subunit
MKSKNRVNSGNGIGIGSAVGLALAYALGRNSSNTMQYIAVGLAIGAGFGAIIDFLNRPK